MSSERRATGRELLVEIIGTVPVELAEHTEQIIAELTTAESLMMVMLQLQHMTRAMVEVGRILESDDFQISEASFMRKTQ